MKLFFLTFSIFLMLYSLPVQADEGMWPITEIARIDLQSKGLTIPVAILYNTDTTGGNSGSPVLNAKGQLIRVNFDRAWEATINDYAWKSYSRSIAVDIRYVLWVTQKFDGADYLLNEMNIPCASIKSPTLNGLKSNNSTPQDDHNRKKIKQYFFAS